MLGAEARRGLDPNNSSSNKMNTHVYIYIYIYIYIHIRIITVIIVVAKTQILITPMITILLTMEARQGLDPPDQAGAGPRPVERVRARTSADVYSTPC